MWIVPTRINNESAIRFFLANKSRILFYHFRNRLLVTIDVRIDIVKGFQQSKQFHFGLSDMHCGVHALYIAQLLACPHWCYIASSSPSHIE